MKPLDLAHLIVNALEDKKGENILLLDLQDVASFTDFFVLCNGTSDRMLDALADGVEEHIRKAGGGKARREGAPRDGWLVLDFGSVIVHLFSPDRRQYYKLEELWSAGKVLLRLQ